MIEQFSEGRGFEEFCGDPTRSRSGGEMFPAIAWRDIRGLGNWLRHQYDRIELHMIWKTVRDDLPALKIQLAKPGRE